MIKKYRLMAMLLPFLLLAGVSCNKDTVKNDADTVTAEGDIVVSEEDAVAVDDATTPEDDALSDDTAIVTDADSDMLPDDLSACDGPPTNDYLENTHTGNEDCPELSKAKFPYFDTDGKIHFCRKCDKVRADDPQCARNLWKEANCKLCKEKPEYDCCGYPCEMTNLQPKEQGDYPAVYAIDSCDTYLNAKNPDGWGTGIFSFKHFNVNEGMVGLRMENVSINISDYPNAFRIFEYDLTSKRYFAYSPLVLDQMTYYKGSYLLAINSKQAMRNFLTYIDSEKRYRVVSGDDNKSIKITLTPAINEKWAFINADHVDDSPIVMLYAEIGKWQWTQIGEGLAYHPNIVGDKLAFYMDDFNGYVCDLNKAPKNISECVKLNREGEEIRHPVLDQANNGLVYYDPVTMLDGFMKLDLTTIPMTYEKIPLSGLQPNTFSIAIHEVEGKTILYNNIYTPDLNNTDNRDGCACYYRADKNKSYCMLPVEFETQGEKKMLCRQSYAEFDGHYLVWQDWQSPFMVVRNMECYCDKHPDLCPLDDYTPNPRDKR